MLIFDAHLDLSLNAIEWNRDLRKKTETVRAAESGKTDLQGRGNGTVTFPEMRKGGIGICVATQLAGCMKPAAPVGSWESPHQAWAMTQAQLAWYRAMEDAGELRQILTSESLSRHLKEWEIDSLNTPIGYILSLEGADSLIDISYLERTYNYGLRALGLSHFGAGRYALGHDCSGPLSKLGKELLKELSKFNIILDITHLSEPSFWQVIDTFDGPIWASHHNCRALVNDPRQLSDEQIQALIQRGAIIGSAFDAWMLSPDWVRGKSTPENTNVRISNVVDHIDHVCQIAGNSKHSGIGTDLDGGFGTEQSPADLNSIADISSIATILLDRGYSESDVKSIMHGNFVRFAIESLPSQ
ncbi:MAG: peptidase M19 [Akkermansiaceae bacterium]|jgi:membrane dipeptidase|nr:peptidase M19 [Akkermansiaceae bacterium]MDG1853055.1 membrane dipeptidase [Verrucomicrobiales bacterium]